MEGQTVGRKIITTIQNFRGSRCQSCKLILFDYGTEVLATLREPESPGPPK